MNTNLFKNKSFSYLQNNLNSKINILQYCRDDKPWFKKIVVIISNDNFEELRKQMQILKHNSMFDINESIFKDESGSTFLHFAIKSFAVFSIMVLLEFGSDCQKIIPQIGESILSEAMLKSNIRIVLYLLNNLENKRKILSSREQINYIYMYNQIDKKQPNINNKTLMINNQTLSYFS